MEGWDGDDVAVGSEYLLLTHCLLAYFAALLAVVVEGSYTDEGTGGFGDLMLGVGCGGAGEEERCCC